jgi:hypothetical protein
VIGYRAINPGMNYNIVIEIDTTRATPTLFAMLHTDDCEAGVYEFGAVQGCDGPVRVNDAVVTPPFSVALIDAGDQPYTDMGVTIGAATIAVDGWMVIHSEANGGPGPVLGQTAISAGANTNIAVELAMDGRTDNLWPMLHIDDCEAGVYEFGVVQGCDAPVIVGGSVATVKFTTLPSVRMADQIVVRGDNAPNMGDVSTTVQPVVVASSVVSDGPGFLVIHTDNNGAPGPVAGYAAVENGVNLDVMVSLDLLPATPVLFPMLHVDTCEIGTYEFGAVQGCDGPVRVNDAVLTFPINAAPSMTYEDQALMVHDGLDPHIHIDSVLIDAPGFLVIHADNNGAPGAVLGYAPLLAGHNVNIMIFVDPAAAGSRVFPMLHYDTCEMGEYEFGAVQGCDGPVRVNEAVVVSPLNILQ